MTTRPTRRPLFSPRIRRELRAATAEADRLLRRAQAAAVEAYAQQAARKIAAAAFASGGAR
jgi:hypothetical protein